MTRCHPARLRLRPAVLSYLPMPTRFLVFLAFLPAYFLSYFLRSTNAVIAEDLIRDLSLTASQLGLMTSLFFAAFAAAQLPVGSLLDRYGARWVTPLLMLSAVLGSLLFGLGQSFVTLAVGRALIGLGVAGILMGALKSFSGWFSSPSFARVSSLYLSLGSLGALSAATPLALLSETFGWRSVFFGGAGVALLSAALIPLFGRDAPEVATSEGEQGGFADIFRSVQFWRVACLNFALVGSLFAYQSLWAGPFVSDVLGFSSVAVGNLLLVLSGGITVGYIVAGFLGERFGLERVLATAAAIFTLTHLGLILFSDAWPRWSLSVLFATFSVSSAFAVLMFAQVRAIFPLHLTGRAVTAVNLFGIGGSALLQWGLGLLIEAVAGTQSGPFPPAAYRAAFTFTGALSCAALLFYLPLVSQSEPEQDIPTRANDEQ